MRRRDLPQAKKDFRKIIERDRRAHLVANCAPNRIVRDSSCTLRDLASSPWSFSTIPMICKGTNGTALISDFVADAKSLRIHFARRRQFSHL